VESVYLGVLVCAFLAISAAAAYAVVKLAARER